MCYPSGIADPDKLMNDAYLTRCVVDPLKRKIYMYSSEGDEKTVDCETVDQFMNMLLFVRDTVGDEVLSYVDPLWRPPKSALAYKKAGKKSRHFFCSIRFFINTL